MCMVSALQKLQQNQDLTEAEWFSVFGAYL